MQKKILIVLMLFCLLPTMARAWTLNTWARSGGGSITVDNGTPQTVVNSSVFKTYTTSSRLIPIAIAASTGYIIQSLYYNTTNLSNNSINNLPSACTGTNQSLTCTVQGPTDQNVWAIFAANLLTVTASAGPGGSVNLTSLSNIYYGSQLSYAKNFVFTPQNNANVQSITINGAPAAGFGNGVTVNPSLPAGVNQQVVLTFPTGYIFTTNLVIAGTFSGPPIVNITPPQTVLPGTLTTLDGSQSTGAGTLTYSWMQVSGPATVSISNTTQSSISFTPTVTGTYTFSLTVTGSMGSATNTTTVNVTSDLAAALRNQCYNCHLANGIGVAQNVFGNWSSSLHKVNGVVCYTCHVGANTGGHPGNLVSGSVNESTFTYTQPAVGTGIFCGTCHNPSVFNSYSSTTNNPHLQIPGISCGFCHNDGVNSFGVHNPDAACVNCHTPNNTYGLPWPPAGAGLGFHTTYTGTTLCTNCHGLHDPGRTTMSGAPHFGSYSSAQFITTNISCNNCHMQSASPGNVISAFSVYSANTDWATTGKANPNSNTYIGPGPYTEANLEKYDFKTLGTPLPATPATTVAADCVRCHTTTGFINYVNPNSMFQDIHAWGTTADRTREMVNCSACHNSDSINGFDSTFSRRSVGIPNTTYYVNNTEAWYNYSSAATKKIITTKFFTNTSNDLVDSNMCIACHSGRSTGSLVKFTSGTATSQSCPAGPPSIVCTLGTGTGNAKVVSGLSNSFWNNVAFIDPHGMGSGNFLITDGNKPGFEFIPGDSSYSTGHAGIGAPGAPGGVLGTEGPCVGCHMSAPRKHVFSPISSSSTGTITGITSTVCASCHSSSGPGFAINSPADLDAKNQGYQAALTVLTAQLAAKGVYYNAKLPPYFFTTNNPALQGNSTQVLNWNALDAQHYGGNLMGAAFNLRLLQTDAGWVHNGIVSKQLLYDTIDYLDDGIQNSSVATTISNLYNAGTINSTTESNALSYIGTR